jgi:hypothetical protein
MGWTVMYDRPTGLDAREFFERELPNTLGGKIVAWGTAPQQYDTGSVFYAAVREPEGEVWAFVALMRNYGPGGYGYKEMSEHMGPAECRAPAKVLDALTSTENEYANVWREACRANLEREAAKPRVRKGDTIKFTPPLAFQDGATQETLTLMDGRRRLFVAKGRRYRLPVDWRRRYSFEVAS